MDLRILKIKSPSVSSDLLSSCILILCILSPQIKYFLFHTVCIYIYPHVDHFLCSTFLLASPTFLLCLFSILQK